MMIIHTRGTKVLMWGKTREEYSLWGVGPKDTHSTAATLFFVWSKDDSFFWQSRRSSIVVFQAEFLFDTNFLTQIYLP